jgi:hypothetical protein
MRALVMSDIVKQGSTNFDFQGIGDHLFDKVFRGEYQKETDAFDAKEITHEYKALFKHWERKIPYDLWKIW